MVDFSYKITVPKRPDHLVTRSHQKDLLQQIAHHRLITIVSPAGYGKTSLLVDFADDSPLPLCWYTIDSSDEDVWTFLSYLAASVDQVFPGSTTQTTSMLKSSSPSMPPSAVGAALARDLYGIDHDFIIVLDDWHLIDHSHETSSIVSSILQRCPHCHFLIASRIHPSIHNQMLLTARREMSSLDERALHFTGQEVVAVLSACFHDAVALEQAELLAAWSQGWITGILLSFRTGVALNIGSEIDYVSQRQVYRYLVEQVLEQQPPDVYQFLLDTSLLAELSAEVCDTILQRSDSRHMLDTLLHKHLFVTEIKPGLLSYHPLFREFLQEHYTTVASQHHNDTLRRIADMHSATKQWLQAFEYYIAAGDHESALNIIASGGQQLYDSGRLETLAAWFSKLADEKLNTTLLCLKGRMLLDLGDRNAAYAVVQFAEMRASADDQVKVMLLNAHIARNDGEYEYAMHVSQAVLQKTSEPSQQATAHRTIGICLHRLGQTELAIEQLNKARDVQTRRHAQFEVAQLNRDLGICYMYIGQLRTAESYYDHADSYWATTGNAAYRAMSLNSKGYVQHLTGRYQEAHNTFQQAQQYAQAAMVPSYEATVLSCIGDLYSNLQLWERAQDAYMQAQRIGGNAHIMSDIGRAQVRLLVKQREYEKAARALRQISTNTYTHQSGEMHRLRSEIACVTGQHGLALSELKGLFNTLTAKNAPIDMARAYLLQAYIAFTFEPAEPAAMITALDRVVEITDAIGHNAFIITEALHLRSMLRRAVSVGWVCAEEWLQRQYDLQVFAKGFNDDDTRSLLVVRTLGVDSIVLNGEQVTIGWGKAREVLYYLLTKPEGVPSDVLREAIWPHLSNERNRDTLRSAIYQLRSVLPRDLILLHGRQTYQINSEAAQIDYDVHQFLSVVDQSTDGDALLEALDLYRGSFLGATESSWCEAMRMHLEQRYLQALELVAQYYEQQYSYADAATMYRRVLTTDSYNETAHAGIMRCLAKQGNRAAAIQQYHELRRLLDEELGLDIDQTSEAEQIYRELLTA